MKSFRDEIQVIYRRNTFFQKEKKKPDGFCICLYMLYMFLYMPGNRRETKKQGAPQF